MAFRQARKHHSFIVYLYHVTSTYKLIDRSRFFSDRRREALNLESGGVSRFHLTACMEYFPVACMPMVHVTCLSDIAEIINIIAGYSRGTDLFPNYKNDEYRCLITEFWTRLDASFGNED